LPLGVRRACDLLDDARYLPGPERADPAYHGMLSGLQEIDATLEYVQFLLSLEPEHARRERLFQVVADYAGQAQRHLARVARQFEPLPRRAPRTGPLGAGCLRPLGAGVRRGRPGARWRH
jgi:hypothetical protein